MVTLKHEKVSKVINVPTSVNEITPDVLSKLSANIVLPEYYALVALCWKVSFADIFFNQKKQDKAAQVVPLLASLHVPENEKEKYTWMAVGKKLVLSRSAIEMGVHIHVPNSASMNSIADWAHRVNEATAPGSKVANINILPKGEFILIEFKVVPVSQITGVIESDVLKEDPFLVNE